MRNVGSALLAMVMFTTSAFADTDSSGPLSPGAPAGVNRAQAQDDNTLWWVLGAGVVIAGIVLVASGSGSSNNGGSNSSTSTSTSTSTGTKAGSSTSTSTGTP